MELIFPTLLLVIYLVYSHLKLKKRVTFLQKQIEALQSPDLAVSVVGETIAPSGEIISKEEAPQSAPWDAAKPDDVPKTGCISEREETADPQKEPAPLAAYVFSPENIAALNGWVKENWFYAIAALSLALSGVFFVQYGIENGYLTPVWRVMGALFLGAALVGSGEWIRRKSGDEEDSHTAYLPSVFSGGGLIALFAGVLAARQMYGLIGPEMALFGLVLVSLLAVVLGWFYGPLLAMVGIVGAMAAPFVVGGSSENSWLFYYYFSFVLVAGMLVDAIKRWAWVSTLSLIFGFAASWLIFQMGAGGAHFLVFALVASVAAAMVPPLQIWPKHAGEMLALSLLRFKGRTPDWPQFPTRIASGGFAAAVLVAVLVSWKATSAGEVWLVLITLAVLLGMSLIWFMHAPALRASAVLPLIGFLFVLLAQSENIGSLYLEFVAGRNRPPETSPPWDLTLIVMLALIGTALIFWRSLRETQYRLVWTGAAALFAPLVIVVLESWWLPVSVLGRGLWAWHGMAVAIVMTLFALYAARNDEDDRRRVAIFALAAMTMISFALMVMLSNAALTLAFSVMVLLAAWVDRKFNLWLLTVFVQVGVVVVGYRLLLDPGVSWAFRAPVWEFLLAYVGAILLFGGAWFLLQNRKRNAAIVLVESAIWTFAGLVGSVILARIFEGADNASAPISLFAMVWLMSAANQLYRMKLGGIMRRVRIGLACSFGLTGLIGLGIVLTVVNPLFVRFEAVQGPAIFDSLMVSYLLPAILFGCVAYWFDHLLRWLRITFAAVSAALAALYLGLEIRRFWQGDILANRGTTDGELYSYTVVMLLISVALLFYAFSKRSGLLRRLAIIGIGLTIAKVFLIDMSGLTGLIRVASFLGLGLSLAGLAWVNRRMTLQWDQAPEEGAPDLAATSMDAQNDDAAAGDDGEDETPEETHDIDAIYQAGEKPKPAKNDAEPEVTDPPELQAKNPDDEAFKAQEAKKARQELRKKRKARRKKRQMRQQKKKSKQNPEK